MALEKNHFYRFGSFRLDPAKHLLLRGQKPVPLMPKAFDTLLVLLENRDRMVGKEELMKLLWPDSFVEEANLAQNVAVLRKALGDSPEEHRYILTVPGRGYRFAAKVSEEAEDEDTDLVVERHSRSRVTLEETPLRKPHSTTLVAFATLLKRTRNWIIGIVAITALLLVLLWRVTWHKVLPLAESDSILVSDFVNTTGEAIFDGPLKQALRVKLAESPYFSIEDDSKARETLRLMGRSPDERLVLPLAREVCERSGAKAVIGGSILRLGDKYVLDLDAQNCGTGASLTRQEINAERQDQVLHKLGDAISPLRRKLGESLSSIQKFDTPVEQATTKSLAALKAYTSGEEKRAQGKEAESIPFYKMAIELDSEFAMAYARAGVVFNNLNQGDLADEYMRKAFERRERISEREKFYIQAHYYEQVTRELDKAIETYRLWSEVYPRDFIPFNSLSNVYLQVGQSQKAIEAGLQALRVNPNHALPYATLARAYERATRFAQAKVICEKAIAEKVESNWTHQILYRIAFVEGDQRAIQQQIDWFKGKPQEEVNLYYQAKAALSLGELRRSRELFERARAMSLQKGLKEQAVSVLNGQAQFDAEVGDNQEARALAELSLRTMPGSFRHNGFAALALARAADTHRAEAALSNLTKQPSLSTAMNEVILPEIRAAIDLDRRNPSAAIQELQRSLPYDLGNESAGATLYYRGLAYLDLKAGKEAAAQFQTILNNRGVTTTDVYWPLAHLGLARASAMTGDTDKASTMYREFLAQWKDADPDLRPLKEAKSEYARLSGQ